MKGYIEDMSKKKSSNKFPFANEIKELKYGFKKVIDDMPDEEFIDFMLLFMDFVEEFTDDELEEWEYDDSEEYEELPF